MASHNTTIHASAVLVGAKAVLIRGPAGSGKSRLAWDLIETAQQSALPFARLVADDRTYVEAHCGRLLARPAPALGGLIEIRGLGIRRLPYEPAAVASLVIDLAAPDSARMPDVEAVVTEIAGVTLPRLPITAGHDALPLVLSFFHTRAAGN